jgi:N-acetylglucosaminyl-diphospho-decaprenol L-rhamnosyltransferase
MDDHPQVGLCGPQLRFPDNSVQLSCRAFPTWRSVLVRRTPLRVFLRNPAFNRQHLLADLDHSLIQEVDWLLGAALMIRHQMPDERYFLYVEDIDYCLRAHVGGWRVFDMPEAVIIHHHYSCERQEILQQIQLLSLCQHVVLFYEISAAYQQPICFSPSG